MRLQKLRAVCDLVGRPGITRIVDERDGWPALIRVVTPSGGTVGIALHVSRVSSHARAPHEMRFQNPALGTPVAKPKGYFPILVGLDDRESPVLVALNAISRVGRARRFSILFDGRVLDEARARGWAVYTSNTAEHIFAFKPSLLPVFIEMTLNEIDGAAVQSFSDDVAGIAAAAGLLVDDAEPARARARRSADVLARHYAFGRQVVAAYGGECAMCGIDSDLVVGAHIYPVSAPDSKDVLWNGLALCANHHTAFDAHRIFVRPGSKEISIHPMFHAARKPNPALEAFIGSTLGSLRLPNISAASPRKGMFDRRYSHYETHYEWARPGTVHERKRRPK